MEIREIKYKIKNTEFYIKISTKEEYCVISECKIWKMPSFIF